MNPRDVKVSEDCLQGCVHDLHSWARFEIGPVEPITQPLNQVLAFLRWRSFVPSNADPVGSELTWDHAILVLQLVEHGSVERSDPIRCQINLLSRLDVFEDLIAHNETVLYFMS